MNKAQVTITCEVVPDSDPDISYLEQEPEWQDRLAEYRSGYFGFVGVRATAEITTSHGRERIVTKLSSPGLWGIESDSGQEYFDSVFAEEREVLLDMLASIRDFVLVDQETGEFDPIDFAEGGDGKVFSS